MYKGKTAKNCLVLWCEINEDCIKYAWHNILYIDDLYLTGRRLYLKQTLQVIVLMFLEGNLKCM